MPGLGFLVSTVDNAAMMQRRRVDELWRSRDFRALVFLGVLGILTLILAFAIRGILGPFILAGILAMLLNPAVNAAERRRVPRLAALLALYGIIAAVLAAAVYFLAPIVTQEFSSLVAQGPAIASYFRTWPTRTTSVLFSASRSISGKPTTMPGATCPRSLPATYRPASETS